MKFVLAARDFVNGEQKGDVVLLEANQVTLSDINEARENLIAKLIGKKLPECGSCPYIEEQKKPN